MVGPQQFDAHDEASFDRPTSEIDGNAPHVALAATSLIFIAALLMAWMAGPAILERFHYAIERGKQRAAFDAAGTALDESPTRQLSLTSQLVSKRVAPSVVHIDTHRNSVPAVLPADPQPGSNDEHSDAPVKLVRGVGAGIVVTKSGDILTNYHVIQGAEQISITLSDDRRFDAQVVGVDPSVDLALLHVDSDDLIPITWGDSESLQDGEFVWAMGSPFGLNNSLTFGIVSSRSRASSAAGQPREYLQTDAAISPGNSGGPLINERGEVIGINTAIMGTSFQGISFAIPAHLAQAAHPRLKSQGGIVQRSWLGVRLTHIPPDRTSPSSRRGAYVADVVEHEASPARLAGLQPGDIITRWDGQQVDSAGALSTLVSQTRASTHVEIELIRAGGTKRLRVEVGTRPLQF